jgi:uncharacterized protein (DUF4415 family)
MGKPPFRSRGTSDIMKAAEAVFRPKPAAPPAEAAKPATLPGARETVTLRLDGDVLAYFQADGPGWQERINAALRKAAAL